jgi:hypothetical protein
MPYDVGRVRNSSLFQLIDPHHRKKPGVGRMVDSLDTRSRWDMTMSYGRCYFSQGADGVTLWAAATSWTANSSTGD